MKWSKCEMSDGGQYNLKYYDNQNEIIILAFGPISIDGGQVVGVRPGIEGRGKTEDEALEDLKKILPQGGKFL